MPGRAQSFHDNTTTYDHNDYDWAPFFDHDDNTLASAQPLLHDNSVFRDLGSSESGREFFSDHIQLGGDPFTFEAANPWDEAAAITGLAPQLGWSAGGTGGGDGNASTQSSEQDTGWPGEDMKGLSSMPTPPRMTPTPLTDIADNILSSIFSAVDAAGDTKYGILTGDLHSPATAVQEVGSAQMENGGQWAWVCERCGKGLRSTLRQVQEKENELIARSIPLSGYLGGLPLRRFDGPRLRHLINQSLNRGECVKIILARLDDAITQVYHAKGYTQSDVDIASLVLHLLQIFLERLPNQTAESVRILIDAADHQNVPRALKLFQAIDKLDSLDRVAMDPFHEKVLMSIMVLHEVINCFLQPSPCIRSPPPPWHVVHQQPADIQGIVKTVFFYVTKQKTLDESQPFYLYQLGQDRLEEVFAELRSLSHDVNMDAMQLAENLSNVVSSTAIYAAHPE
ncbi:hypothetical protein HGRIS_014867 [Hohenbuehelia grisea]|uniref:Uncharacterized protein n=1 Tax=Hohenbuehelia grisea TaxID=104357 RepID=A0ABR3IR08_9AGAR